MEDKTFEITFKIRQSEIPALLKDTARQDLRLALMATSECVRLCADVLSGGSLVYDTTREGYDRDVIFQAIRTAIVANAFERICLDKAGEAADKQEGD